MIIRKCTKCGRKFDAFQGSNNTLCQVCAAELNLCDEVTCESVYLMDTRANCEELNENYFEKNRRDERCGVHNGQTNVTRSEWDRWYETHEAFLGDDDDSDDILFNEAVLEVSDDFRFIPNEVEQLSESICLAASENKDKRISKKNAGGHSPELRSPTRPQRSKQALIKKPDPYVAMAAISRFIPHPDQFPVQNQDDCIGKPQSKQHPRSETNKSSTGE